MGDTEYGTRHTGRRTTQGLRDAAKIDYHSLDAVALSLNLGHEAFHLVAIEGIGDILGRSAYKAFSSDNTTTHAANVDGSHGSRKWTACSQSDESARMLVDSECTAGRIEGHAIVKA